MPRRGKGKNWTKIKKNENANVICLSTEHQGVHKNLFQKGPSIPGSNWNLEMLVFSKESWKPANPKKIKPLGAG